MAHSLETMVPGMDNDLVDFAMQCPVELKLNNLGEAIRLNGNEVGRKGNQSFQKTNDGKQILRDMMSRYIPADIVEAKKQGFSSPDASWFKGESIDFVHSKFLEEKAPIYDYLDIGETKALVNEHLTGQQNRRLLIWSLISFNEFLEAF